jgi:hypothetical protein
MQAAVWGREMVLPLDWLAAHIKYLGVLLRGWTISLFALLLWKRAEKEREKSPAGDSQARASARHLFIGLRLGNYVRLIPERHVLFFRTTKC